MVIGTAKAYTSGGRSLEILIRCVPNPPVTRLIVLIAQGVLGVTDYVSTSCSSVLCMPNSCTVRVVLE